MRDCPEIRLLLEDHRDGLLPPDLHARVEAHLRQCGDCRAEADDFNRLATLLNETATPEPPPTPEYFQAALSSIMARTTAPSATAAIVPVRRPWFFHPTWWLQAAALFLLGAFSTLVVDRALRESGSTPTATSKEIAAAAPKGVIGSAAVGNDNIVGPPSSPAEDAAAGGIRRAPEKSGAPAAGGRPFSFEMPANGPKEQAVADAPASPEAKVRFHVTDLDREEAQAQHPPAAAGVALATDVTAERDATKAAETARVWSFAKDSKPAIVNEAPRNGRRAKTESIRETVLPQPAGSVARRLQKAKAVVAADSVSVPATTQSSAGDLFADELVPSGSDKKSDKKPAAAAALPPADGTAFFFAETTPPPPVSGGKAMRRASGVAQRGAIAVATSDNLPLRSLATGIEAVASAAADEPTSTPLSLYLAAEDAAFREQWTGAIALLERVAHEGDSSLAARAQLRIGEWALHNLDDPVRARMAYEACLRQPLVQQLDPATVAAVRARVRELTNPTDPATTKPL